jgi:hypothetical protein
MSSRRPEPVLSAGSEAREFLPQYAAHAVADCEKTAKEIRVKLADGPAQASLLERAGGFRPGTLKVFMEVNQTLAALIRDAVHIVLPANGEIYRKNGPGAQPVSPAECESFRGLPAPVCCFEYPWTIGKGDRDIAAPKRITLVLDGSQAGHSGPLPPGQCHHALIFSIVFDENVGRFEPVDTFMDVDLPLQVRTHPAVRGREQRWGPRGVLRDLFTGAELPDGPTAQRLGGEYLADLIAVAQACHSLRAGARLVRQTEPSSGRRWKFEKRGVGGFVYHTLKIPGDGRTASGGASAGGTHASPTFHMRRAHLRQLASGKLTFVRQCFVGDRSKGFIGKHYSIEPRNADS